MGSSSNSVGEWLVVSSAPSPFSGWELLSKTSGQDKGLLFSETCSFSSIGLSGMLTLCIVFALELRADDPGLAGSIREKDLEE
jgi:hypothetical protein